MFRAIGVLIAVLLIAVTPSASAAEPRTGVLDSPRSSLIIDIFEGEKDSFFFTGSWEEWTAPEGVAYAMFELVGGSGKTGEAHGHVLAGIDLEEGETYLIRVGGGGRDTSATRINCAIPEWWDCGGAVIAAGGDAATSFSQTNRVPDAAEPAMEHWEGGGPNSGLGSGRAIIHYFLEEHESPEEDPPANDETLGLQSATAPIEQVAQIASPGVPSNPCRAVKRGPRRGGNVFSGAVGINYRQVADPRQRRACRR